MSEALATPRRTDAPPGSGGPAPHRRLVPRVLPILDSYVLGYFWSSYLLCFLTLTLLFVIADAFGNAKQFLAKDTVWWRDIPRYYAGQLPLLFDRFGSFITLAGAMFAVARLERNNELMPMKAGGVSVFRVLLPVFASAALLGGAQFVNTEVVIPALADLVRACSRFDGPDDTSIGILRDAAGNTLSASFFDRASARLRWVTYRVHDDQGRYPRTLYAERATWTTLADGRGCWLFEVGTMIDVAPDGATAQRAIGTGVPRDLGSPAPGEGFALFTSIRPIDIESLGERVSLLSFRDLEAQYRRQSYLPRLRVQLHARIAAPLAHLVLCMIGLPIVLRGGGQRSVFLGLLGLVVICAFFFVTSFILADLGSAGTISPFWAAWAPTAAFGLVGIFMLGEVRT